MLQIGIYIYPTSDSIIVLTIKSTNAVNESKSGAVHVYCNLTLRILAPTSCINQPNCLMKLPSHLYVFTKCTNAAFWHLLSSKRIWILRI